jgi:hypothetical protein
MRLHHMREGSSGEDVPRVTLERRLARNPDDPQLLARLHRAYHVERNFAAIVAMWTAYLARHPGDARAHDSRGAGYFLQGKHAEAKADAHAACGLGLSSGCAHERLIGQSTQPRAR